jgi:hypothetical protein
MQKLFAIYTLHLNFLARADFIPKGKFYLANSRLFQEIYFHPLFFFSLVLAVLLLPASSLAPPLPFHCLDCGIIQPLTSRRSL